MRDPRTGEEFLSRLFAFDYSGNIRETGEEVQIKRVKPRVVRIMYPRSGKSYDLTVHIPRSDESKARTNAKKSQGPGRVTRLRGRQRRFGRAASN